MEKGDWRKLLFGLIAVFVLFQWIATYTGSTRGEAGVLVGLIVVTAMVIVERIGFQDSFIDAKRSVGLLLPKAQGVIVGIVIAKAMFAMIFIFSWLTGSTIEMYPNWQLLMIGIFFQAGIAEETMFRGFLFGHLRQRHTFGKAVFFSAIPFVLVHVILFYQLPWSLAGVSILLSIAMSFPLSKLFEMSGDTIWGPAIVHFAAQAIAKMFVARGDNAWLFPFFAIANAAVIPLIVYAVPRFVRLVVRRSVRPAVAAGTAILATFSILNAQVENSDDLWSRSEVTGDWYGARTRLRERGIDVRFRLTQAYQIAAFDEPAYGGKLDTDFRFDADRLVGWKGMTVQLKTETRFGRMIDVGNGLPMNAAVLTPRSRDAAFSVTALNVTQLLPLNNEEGDAIAVGAGKYYTLDSNREPFTGGAGVTKFMNILANGNPAVGKTVPIITNGATFAWMRKGAAVVSFAVFDSVGSPTKVGFRKAFREGVTFAPGVSIPISIAGRSGRHSFSATMTTRKLAAFDRMTEFTIPNAGDGVVARKSGSWSVTYTFSQYIHERRGTNGTRTGWGLFGTITAADASTNPVSRFTVIGIGGDALFPSRPRDRFGAAYAIAGVSEKLRPLISRVAQIRNEHVAEVFYNFSLTRWISLTGDLQVIGPALKSAVTEVVPGLRLVVAF